MTRPESESPQPAGRSCSGVMVGVMIWRANPKPALLLLRTKHGWAPPQDHFFDDRIASRVFVILIRLGVDQEILWGIATELENSAPIGYCRSLSYDRSLAGPCDHSVAETRHLWILYKADVEVQIENLDLPEGVLEARWFSWHELDKLIAHRQTFATGDLSLQEFTETPALAPPWERIFTDLYGGLSRHNF